MAAAGRAGATKPLHLAEPWQLTSPLSEDEIRRLEEPCTTQPAS